MEIFSCILLMVIGILGSRSALMALDRRLQAVPVNVNAVMNQQQALRRTRIPYGD